MTKTYAFTLTIQPKSHTHTPFTVFNRLYRLFESVLLLCTHAHSRIYRACKPPEQIRRVPLPNNWHQRIISTHLNQLMFAICCLGSGKEGYEITYSHVKYRWLFYA